MRTTRFWIRRLRIGLAGLLLVAGSLADGSEPPRIVTTVGMVTDIVKAVAGEGNRVEGLIGEGIDPHLYKPTRSDLMRLEGAEIIIYNGLKLEGRMGSLLAGQARRSKAVLAVSEAVLAGGRVTAEPGDGGGGDPHLWMSVPAWREAVNEVAAFLGREDPERGDQYRTNAAAYTAELDRLDAYARSVLGTVPESARVLVTAHDAFGYFGREYGFEVRGIQGISTESEAGVRDLEDLLDAVAEAGIPAVFVESSVSDKNVRALVEGARARDHDLEIGGSLFSDAMGAAGTYRGTYIGMLDHNVTTIARALGGIAPEGGMNGHLRE
jgi:manganese/zinc/iron transport system substrate-binding protein